MLREPRWQAGALLHGGPGSGCSANQRRFFDPNLYRAVLLDQRGSGRSRPLANEPDANLGTNTTAHLIADIETLRKVLGVDRWTILGLSWGTTLGLAYAQAHPRRVNALVLAFVTTTPVARCNGSPRMSDASFHRSGTVSPTLSRIGCDSCAWLTPMPPSSLTPIPSFAITRHASGARGKMLMSRSRRVTLQTRATRTQNSACALLGWSRITGGTRPSSRRTN